MQARIEKIHLGELIRMKLEIERKFLVNSDTFKQESIAQVKIIQGFLNTHPKRTVRIRIKGDKGYITVKGKSNMSGTTRTEWEKEMDIKEAESLLDLCEEGIIEKTRYDVPKGEHTYEVDEFYGENDGLVIAEIELNSEDDSYIKPLWLGKEVTGDTKYYNSQLSKNPFKRWE
jgi:adenylate cyclase